VIFISLWRTGERGNADIIKSYLTHIATSRLTQVIDATH